MAFDGVMVFLHASLRISTKWLLKGVRPQSGRVLTANREAGKADSTSWRVGKWHRPPRIQPVARTTISSSMVAW